MPLPFPPFPSLLMLRYLYELLAKPKKPPVKTLAAVVNASAGYTQTLSRWQRLPSDRRSVAAMRGVFSPTPHLQHTLRFVSLEPIPGDEIQPYRALPDNTHDFFVVAREQREGAKPYVLIHLQVKLWAKDLQDETWKSPDWLAVSILNRVPWAVETSPDLQQILLERNPRKGTRPRNQGLLGGTETSTEESDAAYREAWWAYRLDQIYNSLR